MMLSCQFWLSDGQDKTEDVGDVETGAGALYGRRDSCSGQRNDVWLKGFRTRDSGSDLARRVVCNRWNYQDGAKLGSWILEKGETSL